MPRGRHSTKICPSVYFRSPSFIGFENIFRHLTFGDAKIHGLLLDIPMGLPLRHTQALYKLPFGAIDQAISSIFSSTVACLASMRRRRSLVAQRMGRVWDTVCTETGFARAMTP